MLKVDIQSAPSVATLHCSGRLVLGVEAETLRCLTTSRTERHVLLDLSRVQIVDAAGLGLLVELHLWAHKRSARLSIASRSLPAHRLLAMTGLDRVLHLVGLPAEAGVESRCGEWQIMTA
ncbi:MAG TPA: STAS domain-containing protein [Terriglobales bacterium]|nr:STAS domain-containing protein [Terriglobales bacterium]